MMRREPDTVTHLPDENEQTRILSAVENGDSSIYLLAADL